MKDDQKDEILEELWQIKDQISLFSHKDIRKIVARVNEMVQEQGFSKNTLDKWQKIKIA